MEKEVGRLSLNNTSVDYAQRLESIFVPDIQKANCASYGIQGMSV